MMNLFLEIIIFILGLCVGSFINMAVWRLGNKKPLFKESRSFCDYCKKQLNWFDNIPVLSWVLYRGKSRCCRKKLPLLYPIVEMTTGILFLLNNELINYFILGLLVFEAAFDFKYMMLPDMSAFSLIILALLRWIILGAPLSYIICAVLSGLFIFILHKIKIKGQTAMGDGDILLAVFMGLFLGYPNILVAFYIAFIVGAVAGGILIYIKKVGRLTPIPFGPFLILGTLVAYYWGKNIISLFL